MDYTMRRSRTQRSPDAVAADVFKRQHGAISRQQACELGFTPRMIDWRVNTGRWQSIDFGVYTVAGTPETLRRRLMAACLAGPAVVSHRAAGMLWDFPAVPDEIVEVTALRHRRRRNARVIWHESYHLTERDITAVDGIPITRPVRTFLDLGVVLPSNQLEEVLDNGVRRNLLGIPGILRRLSEFGDVRPGARRIRALLESRVPGHRPPESVLETRFLQLMRASGSRVPTPQFEICTNEWRARVDFAYPELKVAIELDGAAHHSSHAARQRDRNRENRLVALGWRVLRFTWEDVHERPDTVLAAVQCVHGLRNA